MADNNNSSATPPDPAEGPAALLQSLFDLADAADEEDYAHARANFERQKTAWAHGWEKGTAGLAEEREAAASGRPPAPD
jgi:hypothetical protein